MKDLRRGRYLALVGRPLPRIIPDAIVIRRVRVERITDDRRVWFRGLQRADVTRSGNSGTALVDLRRGVIHGVLSGHDKQTLDGPNGRQENIYMRAVPLGWRPIKEWLDGIGVR